MSISISQSAHPASKQIAPSLRPIAVLLAIQALLLTVPFFVLQSAFDFPAILRKPADVALPLLHQNQAVIVPAYYVFTLTGVLMIALAAWLRDGAAKLTGSSSPALNIAAVFGIVAGVMQVLGFVRWPFMMPFLADSYVNPATSAAAREAIAIVYESYNRWAGASVGEHLGFIFQGLWLMLLSGVLLKAPNLPRLLGAAGLLTGFGVLISTAEQFGGPLAPTFALINVVANIGLTLWLLALAVCLWRARPADLSARGV